MEMEFLTLFITIILLSLTFALLKRRTKLPPGPIGLPLVGSLPFLDPALHTYFTKLSFKYGPIFSIRLGSKLAVVISSPSLAKAVYRDNDINFCNRDVPAVARVFSYGMNDIAWTPYGSKWRMLRRIAVHEVLSPSSLDAVANLRERELRSIVHQIYTKSNTPVDIGAAMSFTMVNVITSTMWGGILDSAEERESVCKEFKMIVDEIVKLFLSPNLSDFFPILARFDLQGVERKMEVLKENIDRLFDGLIEKRCAQAEKKENDFLGFLLRLEKEGGDSKTTFTRTHVKAILMDLILAGTETTSNTVEWAMAEMLKHPEILQMAQEELDRVVGRENMVQDSHLSQLKYLSLIVKETFRRRPSVPLLVPRCSSSACTLDKYLIPAGTTVYVNAWAIQTDPENWIDPLEFKPERFLQEGGERDITGNQFDYLPFGSGRRICPGNLMAERMIEYFLGTMVHSFDWKIPEGSDIDMTAKFGLVLKKMTPLVAVPTPRLSNIELYSKIA